MWLGLTIAAWVLGVLSMPVAFVMMLANGMKTAPGRYLSRSEWVMAAVLPGATLVCVGVALCLSDSGRRVAICGGPGVIGVVCLLVISMQQSGDRR